MNELSPKTARRALHHAMPQKLPLRAGELVAIGWTRELRAVPYGRGAGVRRRGCRVSAERSSSALRGCTPDNASIPTTRGAYALE